jgi:LacI family transcriptional regulator
MTVREIAELTGVSIGTVDRVLHKRGRVLAATREKIEAIIEKHQFIPNPIARQLKRNKPYRFCALIPRRDQDAGYWGQAIAGIERAASEVKSLGVETKIIEYDRYNPAAFLKISDSVCEGKPDGLLFAPILPKMTRPFIEKCSKLKIPFVFIDTDMPGTSPLSVILQDPFSGGYLAGRLFHLFAGDVLEPVVVLDAHTEDYNIISRREGFLSYAQKHGFPIIVQEHSDYGGLEISTEDINRFLKRHRRLSGIIITNSLAHKAAEAVISKRGKMRPILIGYDLIPENRRLLLEGRIDAIISQRPEEQGREALNTLFHSVALGQKVEPRRDIPLDVYIQENTP